MDHELLKRLLDFLADQGAQLNRWEAKRLELGIDCQATHWKIKDRDFVDYLVERSLQKDKTFWHLSEKIWQTSFEFGPLHQPFLYSPVHLWMQWRQELTGNLRKLIVQEAASKRLSHISPAQIALWVLEVAQSSERWSSISEIVSPAQHKQWEDLLNGLALVSSYEDFKSLERESLHTCHTQKCELSSKYEPLELSTHQLDLLYRLRARQQIEQLVQKFHHTQTQKNV